MNQPCSQEGCTATSAANWACSKQSGTIHKLGSTNINIVQVRSHELFTSLITVSHRASSSAVDGYHISPLMQQISSRDRDQGFEAKGASHCRCSRARLQCGELQRYGHHSFTGTAAWAGLRRSTMVAQHQASLWTNMKRHFPAHFPVTSLLTSLTIDHHETLLPNIVVACCWLLVQINHPQRLSMKLKIRKFLLTNDWPTRHHSWPLLATIHHYQSSLNHV